jgi:hypothetical protein
MHFSKASTINGEILSESKNLSSIDRSVSSYNSVAWYHILVHVEISTSMFHKGIHLLERAVIKKHFEAFSCSHFASFMLSVDPYLAAASFNTSLSRSQVP